MESVCDKPQAARTRGPKIRVVGAIRVDTPQAGRAECRGKAFQAIVVRLLLPRAALCLPPVTYIGKPTCIAFQARLRTSLVFHSSFILHFSLFTLHLNSSLFTLHLSNGLCFIELCIVL